MHVSIGIGRSRIDCRNTIRGCNVTLLYRNSREESIVPTPPRVAFVVSNRATSSVTGWPIGSWLADVEAAEIATTTFVAGPPMESHAIADCNLITGQQQHSGAEAARLAIGQLA